MRPTLSGFLIGLVLFSLFVGIGGIFMSEVYLLKSDYSTDYDPSRIEVYNKLDTVYATSKSIKSNIATNITADKNLLLQGIDIVGGFFSSGLASAKTIFNSYTLLEEMTSAGADELNTIMGGSPIPSLLKTAVFTIVSILLFVGIGLAILLRREWL